MNPSRSLLPWLALAAGLLLAPALPAADDHAPAPAGQLVAPTAADAPWLAQAEAAYPLKTCVVSGEQLGGDMGRPVNFIYRQAGRSDRLVRFCCKSCLKDFRKEPEKYLKAIDAAVQSKPAAP